MPIDQQLRRLLETAAANDGELHTIGDDEPEALYPGLQRAVDEGLMRYLSTRMDEIDFWLLTPLGEAALRLSRKD